MASTLKLVFNPFTCTLDWISVESGGGGGGQSWQTDIANEIPDGSRTSFTTTVPYLPGGIMLFLNGLRENHFNEIDGSTFEFETAPLLGDEITLFIQTS